MNIKTRMTRIASAMTLGASAALLIACSAAPVQNPAVDSARLELTQLQADPQLASRAPVAIKDAEIAVQAAEAPTTDPEVKAHLGYLASNKVKAAHALASARLSEDQLKTASSQRDQIQLAARTQEADQAKVQADQAKSQAGYAKQQAAAAETQTALARQQTDSANQQAAMSSQQADAANARASDLANELAALHAQKTDRGTVFTLGDVVFATGKADLKPGAMANFDRLATALSKQTDRHVTIEGHTDSVGSEDSNMSLSQRRADAVKGYLVNRGVDAGRISAVGKGEGFPVTSNSSAAGRQKNRRVEVIIENAPAAVGG
jgi:outer membrane protein OmpA-like peptidoglycan-associated protein